MSRRGFTLVEVLVAVVVLSVGIVAVMRGFETALLALRGSADTLQASSIIAEKMSQVRAGSLSRDESDEGSSFAGDTSGTARGFSWKMDLDEVSMSGAGEEDTNSVVKVTVTVSGRGSRRTYTGETYIQQ
jgi:prepilin-type N-terminal cleavage/methylation domain-containing protein